MNHGLARKVPSRVLWKCYGLGVHSVTPLATRGGVGRQGPGERSALTYSKPVGLWAVPRSVSTALERVFVERGDFKVFHEPFSASYYYSPERRSDRFAGMEAKEEYVLERILGLMLEVE